MDFIPQGAFMVVKISNFERAKQQLRSHALVQNIPQTALYPVLDSASSVFDHVQPEGDSFLSFNKLEGKKTGFTFAMKIGSGFKTLDSLPGSTVKKTMFKNETITKATLAGNTTFSAVRDSVFILSNAETLLKNALGGTSEKLQFQKPLNLNDASLLTAVHTAPQLTLWEKTHPLGDKLALTVAVSQNNFKANGIVQFGDTLQTVLAQLRQQTPQPITIASVTPTDALGAVAISLSSAALFFGDGGAVENDSPPQLHVFENFVELGSIKLKKSHVVAAKSLSPGAALESLSPFVSVAEKYRGVQLYHFSETDLFAEKFSPFIKVGAVSHVFQLNSYFLFTENETVAKVLITSIKNNATLASTENYKQTLPKLSSASSYMHFAMGGAVPDMLQHGFFTNGTETAPIPALKDYPLAVQQFVMEPTFAHVAVVCLKTGKPGGRTIKKITERSIAVKNGILGEPLLYGTKGARPSVVFQDAGNVLHHISLGGKFIFEVPLKSPVLGSINEVALKGNSGKQLAFVTKNKLYVVNEKGQDVAPFPLTFNDEITQPLAVFDYDNNRNYRFLITQGKGVRMFNAAGKNVKGFTFKKAKTELVFAPQHIRIANKDYLLFAEKSGRLNILDRTGKGRVKVGETFMFSETPVMRERNSFVVITADKKKKTIGRSGKVSTINLDVSDSYYFTATAGNKATLDDNRLRINGKLVELPLGIYTQPVVKTVLGRTYVLVTETQEKKVYMYTTKGTLLSGFPVYGASRAVVAPKNERVFLLTTGQGEIVVYSF